MEYIVLSIYKDCTSKIETINKIESALYASVIYLEDPNCYGVKIWEKETCKIILDYLNWRKD